MNTRVRTTLQAMKAPLNLDKVSAHHRSLLVINFCDLLKKKKISLQVKGQFRDGCVIFHKKMKLWSLELETVIYLYLTDFLRHAVISKRLQSTVLS